MGFWYQTKVIIIIISPKISAKTGYPSFSPPTLLAYTTTTTRYLHSLTFGFRAADHLAGYRDSCSKIMNRNGVVFGQYQFDTPSRLALGRRSNWIKFLSIKMTLALSRLSDDVVSQWLSPLEYFLKQTVRTFYKDKSIYFSCNLKR